MSICGASGPLEPPITKLDLQMPPNLPPSKLTNVKHYPLPLGAWEGIAPVLEDLKKWEIVISTHSASISLLWPVRKPNGKWRLPVDYCCLSADTDSLPAAIPNITGLAATIQEQAHRVVTTTDIKEMCCMVPLQRGDQHQFPFVCGATIYFYRASSGVQEFTHLNSPCAGKRMGKDISGRGSESLPVC